MIILDEDVEGELEEGDGEEVDGVGLLDEVAGERLGVGLLLLPLLLLLEPERLIVIPDPRRYSVMLQQGVLYTFEPEFPFQMPGVSEISARQQYNGPGEEDI